MSKLLLDSKALERLLGTDKELQIKITESIANQFADKFLKSLVNDKMNLITKDAILKEISQYCFTNPFSNNKYLSEEFQQRITTEVSRVMKLEIHKIITDTIYNSAVIAELNRQLDNASNKILNEITDENLNKRIDVMVNKKLKEKLGINN